jgi:hypothetical protein
MSGTAVAPQTFSVRACKKSLLPRDTHGRGTRFTSLLMVQDRSDARAYGQFGRGYSGALKLGSVDAG